VTSIATSLLAAQLQAVGTGAIIRVLAVARPRSLASGRHKLQVEQAFELEQTRLKTVLALGAK